MKLEYNRHARTRMFENDFLEFCSNIHPAVPFVVYIPVVVGLHRLGTRPGAHLVGRGGDLLPARAG